MESIGQFLRTERELRQLTLEELAQTTRIPLRSLQLLEDDRLDTLPGDVFVRGFVKSYAKAVGLPFEEALRRYEESSRPSKNPALAAVAAVTQPDRGRRFGLAIALVILLILFTLALSIVLRPRHRDAPVELSRATLVLPAVPGRTSKLGASGAGAPRAGSEATVAWRVGGPGGFTPTGGGAGDSPSWNPS